MKLRYLVLFALASSCDPKPEAPPTTPTAPTSSAPAPSATPAAPASAAPAAPTASAAPTPSAAPAAPAMLYACKATVKDAEVVVADVLPADKTPKATVTITTKKATRKLVTTVAPHAGTETLVFESYGEGDQKPATEKLTKGKSQIVRLVTNGDKREIYASDDFWGKGSDLKPAVCAK